MEYKTIKEDGQVQKKSKNHALSVMPNVSIVRKRLVILSQLLKKNTIKLPTTALLLLSVSVVKSSELVMMENLVGLLAFLC